MTNREMIRSIVGLVGPIAMREVIGTVSDWPDEYTEDLTESELYEDGFESGETLLARRIMELIDKARVELPEPIDSGIDSSSGGGEG